MFKRIIIGIFFVIALGPVNSLHAQTGSIDKNDITVLENRILELERKNIESQTLYDRRAALFNKMEEQLKQDLKNKKEELANTFHELKNDQTKEFNELKNNIAEKTIPISVLLVLIVIVPFIGIWAAVKLFSEKIAIKILSKNFEIESKDLADLLKEVKTDYKLKQNKKILVVTPDYREDLFLKKFFSDMGFPVKKNVSSTKGHVDFISFSNGQKPEKGFDLVLFNDENGLPSSLSPAENGSEMNLSKQQQKEIEDYLEQYDPQTARLYFGPKRINLQRNDISREKKNMTTFTNARLQIYGNLMNALRF